MGKVWAHVFVTAREPRKGVQAIRDLESCHGRCLVRQPDVIALVEGSYIKTMDAVN